ncbi:hypothetical protein HYPSUDRAFT_145776 [Hypholoma sublateritium FD-334 SS-4]|uniref:Uncharacterized protein n=1 Tax=Hypholoma sublateritium (strain FD-334 SS-4) TaxID=945553 RepID=A0A0D2NFZ5_HYPSF|nr:hypothetical protein HYPSUDRAFT_145776 [Hypholoma sublateritium FD-334 SS-4]
MTRQLRPRKGKPSYATLFAVDEDEDEPRAGPSSITRTFVEDEVDSESDFEPERKADNATEDPAQEEDEDEDEDAVGEIDDEEDVVEVIKPRALKRKRKSSPVPVIPKPKGKLKVKTDASAKVIVGPKGTKRQNYVLPTPSVNHRHRAVPLYSREGRVERLTASPNLFSRPSTTLTNGFTENSKVTDRVNKAWGYNVGPGPLWELAEDRAWYKEALTAGDDVDIELVRRPRVYGDVALPNDWEILNAEDAALYMPTDDVTTEEGNLKPPPPTVCYLGPIKRQSRETLSMMGSIPMANFSSASKAHVFNAGAPVWGLDWCPIHVDDRAAREYTQYLAVAPFPSQSHSPDIGRKVCRPSYACIQLWTLESTQKSASTRKSPGKTPDRGHMKCKMVVCLDSGPAYDLKWCPLPSHDPRTDGVPHKKLGLLGGTFEDGSFSVFVIPDPSNMAPESSQPIYVKLPRPILRIELEETACWTFDWANSEVIAIGTTNGTIAVYNIGLALKTAVESSQPTITDLVPTHYLSVHQSAIRALAWIKSPPCWPSGVPRVDQDPTAIASAGYDGMECLTDIRDGRGSVMNRTRDVINALVFSAFAGGPITMDHENTVKAYSASPSMLGRGHSLFEPQGPVWTVHASDFHPQLVAGAADGSCSTTNILRSTRRGGSVPFFVHKIFQMDYNRKTKEFRMLDQFLPQETYDRTTATRIVKGKVKKRADIVIPTGTGAWPREVGVHRVVWNNGNGLGAAALMAAGTASGLCRVDVLWGRWLKDKIPYGGVAGVRMEDGNAMEVDTELSDEDSEGA